MTILPLYIDPGTGSMLFTILIGALGTMTGLIARFKGWSHRSKLIDGMGVGAYSKQVERARTAFDWLSLRMPVTGTLVQRTAVSRVTRTLGTLLSSGVPILQSLMIVRDTTGNRIVSNALQSVHDAVKEGEGMTAPLSQGWVFPPMVVSMVQVGEETGALPDMLTRIANTYDDEVDNAVAGMTAAIEPALIIFLAVVVGTIVIAMFLPMIKIISSVSGAAG